MTSSIIAAEGMSLLVSLIILYGNLFETRQHTRRRLAFSLTVAANSLAMLCDMVSWILDGDVTHVEADYVLTSLSTILSFAVYLFFVSYIYFYISEKRTISRVPFIACATLAVLSIFVTTVACFSNLLFYFEDGVYMDGPYYWVYLLANALLILIVFFLICISHRHLGLHSTLAALSFIIIPLTGMLINAVNPDFSMTYPAITLSLLITFIMMQSEHETNLIRQELVSSQRVIHDDLTGLLNRRAYTGTLDRMSGDGALGVIFCDVNGLKYTNDRFGHEAGDELLRSFANVLRARFRREEIFRISGDEFVLLLPDISNSSFSVRVEQLQEKLSTYPVPPACVGSAYGIMGQAEVLVRLAEQGMYAEKQKFYDAFPDYRR